jgi:hypothetical protein
MKRKRPVRHIRRIKTKRGVRRVLVNKNVRRKRMKMSKYKDRGIVHVDERKIFKHISDPDKYYKEYGGAIDFDMRGRVEQINVSPGYEYEIDLPPDYEVQYHTHPDHKSSPPTSDDVIALLKNKNQQAEIIFQDGKAFVLVKTPLTRALSRLPATQLKRRLDKAFFSSRKKRNWERSWADYLEKQGFAVYVDRNVNKPLKVKIHPVEPIKKMKRKRVPPFHRRRFQ